MLQPVLLFALLAITPKPLPREAPVPNHYVLVYRNHQIPTDIAMRLHSAGATITSRMDHLGIITLSAPESLRPILAAQPNVTLVLQDRYVTAHSVLTSTSQLSSSPKSMPFIDAVDRPASLPTPPNPPITSTPNPIPMGPLLPADAYYGSPQGWATLVAGGFGDNIPGGPSTGPWDISRGAGIRIAILDSGVDANHPDISPNLTLNLSEINQLELPSPCDDGSPKDQQGHGTFVASLATGALGPTTGLVVGVAPQATLLNIKVLQRMPSTSPGTTLSQCEAGQPTGLLSWVLQGIDDAVANHADIISLSLGTLVDTTTGDGAGWQATFDAVTYAATQSGTILVASLGNDGLDLTNTLRELPAQSRGVLPIQASTNPACAENQTPNAPCVPGPITIASYSNTAPNALAAPGGNLPEASSTGTSGFIRGACSTGLPNTLDGLPANGQSFGCFNLGHTPYIQAMGTSASAPLAAAAAAILRAAHPTWSTQQIIQTLLTTANPSLNLPAALALPNP